MWLDEWLLDELIRAMPLAPGILVSTDWTLTRAGHYQQGEGAIGGVLRFSVPPGLKVYRITGYSFATMSYSCSWPD